MWKNYKNCRNSICHLVLALARVSSEWLKISDCDITEIINLAKPGRKTETYWVDWKTLCKTLKHCSKYEFHIVSDRKQSYDHTKRNLVHLLSKKCNNHLQIFIRVSTCRHTEIMQKVSRAIEKSFFLCVQSYYPYFSLLYFGLK